MKQPFESGPAGARTGPGTKISAMLGNKVGRRRAVRRHERTMPSSVRTFDNPQSQLRIRLPSHGQIRRFLGVIRSISKPAGEQITGTALGWYWKGTTETASWALGRRETGEMIVRTTQVDATACIRTWDRTAQKVGTSDGLPRDSRKVKENKTRRAKTLGRVNNMNREAGHITDFEQIGGHLMRWRSLRCQQTWWCHAAKLPESKPLCVESDSGCNWKHRCCSGPG